MNSSPTLDRRGFLKLAGTVGTSLVLGIRLETAPIKGWRGVHALVPSSTSRWIARRMR